MTDFIKTQQELRQEILAEMKMGRRDGKTYIDEEWLLTEYEKAVITNTGKELQRLAEGERKEFVPADYVWEGDEEQEVGDWKFVPKEDGMYCLNCERFVVEEGCICGFLTINTLKKHITSVTGVE